MDYDHKFKDRFSKLNEQQKAAALTTEGPVMVIAGPGAGKTELLSLRIAQILKTTDTPASSILCLTFTDAAAANMRDRLTQIIGPESSKVAIHTFHSFGAEIINRYPEYFFAGANVVPVEVVKQLEIIESLIENLPINSPLNKKHPQQGLTYLNDTIKIIGFLKQAGLSPDAFTLTLKQNQEQIETANNVISAGLKTLERINKQSLGLFKSIYTQLSNSIKSSSELYLKRVVDLFKSAINQSEIDESTKPLTLFKNNYLAKDLKTGDYILKDTSKQELLMDLSLVYKQYQSELYNQGLFDFDDMLLSVLESIEKYPELQSELQERYLYVQVDEFQDTNGVQMLLLEKLINNPINEERPNVCVVGDDDQAIYKFQGANIDNILKFKDNYPETKIITLTKNYRSTQSIIDYMLPVIRNAEIRIETQVDEVEKELISGKGEQGTTEIELTKTKTAESEASYVLDKIKALLDTGVKASDIAVITRTHRELKELVPYLNTINLPINYERQDNLLNEPTIRLLINLLKQIYFYSSLAPKIDESGLPELLSHPLFRIPPNAIWELSISARNQHRYWLSLMTESDIPELKTAAALLTALADQANTYPVSRLLTNIIDNQSEKADFPIPPLFHDYYQKQDKVTKLNLIKQLNALISYVGNFNQEKQIKLTEFISKLAIIDKYNFTVPYSQQIGTKEEGISLLTAHKAKGLEFKHVFILNASDQNWLKKKNMNKISLPINLNLLPDKEDSDDQIRLIYVALSRAQTHLYISYHETTNSGRKQNALTLLSHGEKSFTEQKEVPSQTLSLDQQAQVAEVQFLQLPPKATIKTLLGARMQNYKLSPSHLVSFLDIIYSGPQDFFQSRLLGYPTPPSTNASYGSAMHKALELMQVELRKTQTLPPLEFINFYYKTALKKEPLTEEEVSSLYNDGIKQLTLYYQTLKSTFSPHDLPEQNFSRYNINVNGAILTGKLDKIALSESELRIIDYKTGTPITNFTAAKFGYKAWKFKLQLGFYQLLLQKSPTNIIGSREVSTEIHFLDAKNKDELILSYTPTQTELEEIATLAGIVYRNITDLNFPETEHYPKTLAGVKQFISDLKTN